jgi:tRNA pseudouridine38-40 synthase
MSSHPTSAQARESGNSASCFQAQKSGCGVQDALERALAEIAGHAVTVNAAGRTDAGVHAVSQIVHFDTTAVRPESAWVRGVNAHLPRTAAVLWAREVPEEFHARFAAVARHYTYLLLTRPERPALLAGQVGWYHHPLDSALLDAGAAHLLGTHDFSAFRAAECQARSPVKSMTRVAVVQQGPFVRFDFSANAFLQHMVRNIVGALVYVGIGRRPPQWVGELLQGDAGRGCERVRGRHDGDLPALAQPPHRRRADVGRGEDGRTLRQDAAPRRQEYRNLQQNDRG